MTQRSWRGQVRAAIIYFGGFLGAGNRKIAVDWNAAPLPATMIVSRSISREIRLRQRPDERIGAFGPDRHSRQPASPPAIGNAGLMKFCLEVSTPIRRVRLNSDARRVV